MCLAASRLLYMLMVTNGNTFLILGNFNVNSMFLKYTLSFIKLTTTLQTK